MVQLHQRRAEICEILLKNRSEDASLKKFHALWSRVPKEACSEDEAFVDGGRIYYQRIRPAWRNPAPDVEAWFHTFDLLHMSTHYKEDGSRQPGRLPRHRIRTTDDEMSSPGTYPKRLPRNFYDKTWLETLDEYEEKKLQIRPAMKLIFTDAIQRYV
jgi:hypothetical protein